MRGDISQEIFDLIAVKFLANLSKDELTESRIGFHFEKAYFYFLDSFGFNFKESAEKKLQVVQFCNQMLKIVSFPQHLKLTGPYIEQLINENYMKIPVHGVILLNMQQSKAVLVESVEGNRLGFPKGKIREGEEPYECAIRETEEEIGFKVKSDPNYYVEVEIFSKSSSNKSFSKLCRFFITKIEESCVIPRKSESLPLKSGIRKIIYSSTEIKSIGWYSHQEISELITRKKVNTPSKLAYFELSKKLTKNVMYRQKKMVLQKNPLEEFQGFDEKKLAEIFLK